MQVSTSFGSRVRDAAGRPISAVALVVGALMCALLIAPAGAAAQDPTDAQYDPSIEVLSQTGSGGDGGTLGALPFTGLDVAMLAAVAVGLGVAGLVLRRRTREADPESVTR